MGTEVCRPIRPLLWLQEAIHQDVGGDSFRDEVVGPHGESGVEVAKGADLGDEPDVDLYSLVGDERDTPETADLVPTLVGTLHTGSGRIVGQRPSKVALNTTAKDAERLGANGVGISSDVELDSDTLRCQYSWLRCPLKGVLEFEFPVNCDGGDDSQILHHVAPEMKWDSSLTHGRLKRGQPHEDPLWFGVKGHK